MGKRSLVLQQRQKEKKNIFIGIITGFGLILLAAASLYYLSQQTLPPEQGYSTIPVEVNYAAPELSLENVKGTTESLTDFKDKVVLLNNWATWCPPCKAEMPTLVAFYNEHAADGLMIIAVEAGEPKDQVKQFAEQYQMPFAVWVDPQGKSLNAFKNGNLPNSYVIDRNGIVRLTWTGEINRATLEKYVTPLLADN